MLKLDELDAHLATGTVKLVAVGHVSNAAGTINPVADIVARAHAAGAVVCVDGSQAVPQIPVDVGEIDADFYVWTGHKVYGPTGIGVLHGRPEILDAMPPFLGGGHMIASVSIEEIRFGTLPGEVRGGDAAGRRGHRPRRRRRLPRRAWAWRTSAPTSTRSAPTRCERLGEIPGVEIMGPLDAERRGALVAFTIDGHPPARRRRDPG